MKKAAIIFGQIFILFLILLFGIFLIDLKIPGNGGICDAEQILLFWTWVIFVLLVGGITINSFIFYAKNKWKKYRIGVILTCSILLFLSIFLRGIVNSIYFGKEKFLLESNESIFIKIQLFENGKFFAYTYDISCEIENYGTYKISNNKLNLNFKNKKSEYLGTEYIINNNKVNCLNCKQNIELKINN